jgi:hypothetical protein
MLWSKLLGGWENVCAEKSHGGLGIRKLEDQNHCLPLKFVHKIHEASSVPWKNWFLTHSEDGSFLARLIQEKLPRYRALTSVIIGDGKTTVFWLNRWILNTTLAVTFPALFSHCVRSDIYVCEYLTSPLSSQLQPRLSRCAREEQ